MQLFKPPSTPSVGKQGQACKLGNIDTKISGRGKAARRTWKQGHRKPIHRVRPHHLPSWACFKKLAVPRNGTLPASLSGLITQSKPTVSPTVPCTVNRILLTQPLLQGLCQTHTPVAMTGSHPYMGLAPNNKSKRKNSLLWPERGVKSVN